MYISVCSNLHLFCCKDIFILLINMFQHICICSVTKHLHFYGGVEFFFLNIYLMWQGKIWNWWNVPWSMELGQQKSLRLWISRFHGLAMIIIKHTIDVVILGSFWTLLYTNHHRSCEFSFLWSYFSYSDFKVTQVLLLVWFLVYHTIIYRLYLGSTLQVIGYYRLLLCKDTSRVPHEHEGFLFCKSRLHILFVYEVLYIWINHLLFVFPGHQLFSTVTDRLCIIVILVFWVLIAEVITM
jgi:hypothetical protein